MPTLLALLLASCAGFLTSRLPLPAWGTFILAPVVWLVVFISVKKFLLSLRP